MRHRIQVIWAFALTPCLVGCAERVDYFEPTARAGTLSSPVRCDAVYHGVNFDADLPDQRRFFLVSVNALSGPRAQVSIFKYYHEKRYDYWGIGHADEAMKAAELERAPFEAWAHDRTIPFAFSSNRIEVSWGNGGHLSYVMPGLVARGDQFESTGNMRSTIGGLSFDFQLELNGFSGDWFVVSVPAVTIDGTTVTPVPVRFTHKVKTVITAINC